MSGRRWGKPWWRWTAFLVPEANPALPRHCMGKIQTSKPCLHQSGRSQTAAHGQGTAQGGQAQEGGLLTTPRGMTWPQAHGQTWAQLLSLSRMLGTALTRALSGGVIMRTLSGDSPCRIVCSPSKASTEDGQLLHLLAWTGTHSHSMAWHFDPLTKHDCNGLCMNVMRLSLGI